MTVGTCWFCAWMRTKRLDSTLNQIARYAAAIAEQVRADEATEDTAVLADAIESLADGLVADRRKAQENAQ